VTKKERFAITSLFTSVVGGTAFGYWLDNFAAGFWMGVVLMMFGPIEVRIVKFPEDEEDK